MDRRSLLLLLVGTALLGSACDYFGDRPIPVTRPPHAEETVAFTGEELYQRDCAWCHASDGTGTPRGPDLDGELDGAAYTHFMLSTGRMPITVPEEEAQRSPVSYSPEEIESIIEHVVSFGGSGPAVPAPDPEDGDASHGQELYAENCAACHSTTGVGGALTSGETAPSLLESTPVQVAEAMLVGPDCPNDDPDCGPGDGAMPVFDDFSDDEVDAIVAYVGFLQETGNRGGLSLGRIGPVTEGAVALFVGLVFLVAFIRWIGTSVGEDR